MGLRLSMPNDKRHPRVDQLIASLGYASRRDVPVLIKKNILRADGIDKLKADMRLDPELLRVGGEPLDHPHGLLILLHKPLGVVCSHNEDEGQLVYDLLPARWSQREPQLVSVGRLDKETSGLLLLTDQHDLVHRLTSPKHHVAKTYHVRVSAPLDPELVTIFRSGELVLKGEDKPCLPAELTIHTEFTATVVLNEGRYHQVRRMFAANGCPVVELHRSRFGALELGCLAPGEFVNLPLTTQI